jgi:anti-sigma B factor antagonist
MEFTSAELTPGVVLLSLTGRFNMITAQSFRDYITKLVEDGSNRVVVDLSEVKSFDSSALGALIGGLKATRKAGGDLRLSSPTEQVKLVLRLTNVDNLLICYDNAKEAFSNV